MPADHLPLAEFARRVLVAVAIGALALLLWRMADAALLAFAAVLVAILLRTAAAPLARHTTLPDTLAVAVVALLVLAGLGAVAWLAGAEVRAQVTDLYRRLPGAWEALQERFGGTDLGERLLERAGDAAPDPGGVLAGVTGAATSVAGAVGNLVLVLFGGLYFATQPGLYRAGLVKLAPPPTQANIEATLDAGGEALRLWLLGQLLSMALVAMLTTLGLWLLGMPAYLALGLLAGLAEFVPVIGSVLAAVPAFLLALTVGLETTAWTLLLYLAIQQIQGNLVTPLLTRRMVDLPPALTLFSIVAFGLVFGFVGVLLAAPLTVVAFVAVKKLWVRDALGEETEVPGEGRRTPEGDA